MMFIIACGALVLFSGLFYLLPKRGVRLVTEDPLQANLAWYRLRRGELAAENNDALAADVELRLLEDAPATLMAAEAPRDERHFPVWWLLPLVTVVSALLYYQLGAAPDVAITQQLQSLEQDASQEDVQELMATIAGRAGQRPDNLHYQALLGRYYMGQQDYPRAAQTYQQLAEAAPGDAMALAYAAQSRYLAGDRSLDATGQGYAEQALAIDPGQRTALGLLGMAAFEQQQYRAAIAYWQRLLASELPGSEGAEMIAGVIAQAQARLGEDGAEVATTGVTATGLGVSVRIALPEGATVNPGDTIFVLARSAGSNSRMPIAVTRLTAAQLPTTLRLDDSNSMAGQKLSEAGEVVVSVQLSPSGQPGEAAATWTGQIGPLQPSAAGDIREIVLAPAHG